jgi:hypothetical protein
MEIKTQTPEPLHLVFPRLLRTLSKQAPRLRRTGYTIGPLRVGKASQKLPSREVVLTVVLGHLFDRVARHGDGPLRIVVDEPINKGRAWDAAADFASAALDRPSVDPNAAKKFLTDHRGHLYYDGWPRSQAI